MWMRKPTETPDDGNPPKASGQSIDHRDIEMKSRYRWRRIRFISLALVAVALASERSAHAYIDPGTGSYLFQIAVASLAAAAFTIKVYWRRIRSIFRSSKEKRKEREESKQ